MALWDVELFAKWMFPKIGVPQNGWFIIRENPIQMDDLGVKTTIFGNIQIKMVYLHAFYSIACSHVCPSGLLLKRNGPMWIYGCVLVCTRGSKPGNYGGNISGFPNH